MLLLFSLSVVEFPYVTLYFCCSCSMLRVIMSVCIWSSAIWFPELQLPMMLPVLFCFII